jgi:hypothetical protein
MLQSPLGNSPWHTSEDTVVQHNQNNLVRQQVLASFVRSSFRSLSGLTLDQIYWEIRGATGYMCHISDVDVALSGLVMEEIVSCVFNGREKIYRLNEDGSTCLLDIDVKNHCCQI